MPTPGCNRRLDHEVFHIRIEDLDQLQIEVSGLHAHPGHGRQGEVVYQDGYEDATHAGGGLLDANQEDRVETEQRQREGHEDAARRLSSQ